MSTGAGGEANQAPRVHVRVPATSANLGPGFDAFGLALGYYDEIEVGLAADGLSVRVECNRDTAGVAQDEDNLVVRAVRAAFDELGHKQPGLEVRCVNRVPHGRGLGSSAAAIVGGLAAGWALASADEGRPGPAGPGPLDRAALLRVAAAMEGHPDNVAAAVHGGFTVAWTDPEDGPRAARVTPAPELRPVAFVPSARQSTAASRGRLPAQLGHADAAFSAGRAGLLALAVSQPAGWLAERAELLLAATEDRLHQPYRLPGAPESAELLGRLRDRGIAAVLSGSGPTVLALAVGGEQAAAAVSVPAPGFAVLPLAVDTEGVRVTFVAG